MAGSESSLKDGSDEGFEELRLQNFLVPLAWALVGWWVAPRYSLAVTALWALAGVVVFGVLPGARTMLWLMIMTTPCAWLAQIDGWLAFPFMILGMVMSAVVLAWLQGLVTDQKAHVHMKRLGRTIDKLDETASLEELIKQGRPFAIFLRGFSLERARTLYNENAPISEPQGLIGIGFEHDHRIHDAIKEHVPAAFPIFTVVNRRSFDPYPVFPQVRVPDECWLSAVSDHVDRAAAIIVYYSYPSTGLDEECRLIGSSPTLLSKCWIICNRYSAPKYRRKNKSELAKIEAAARWRSEWTTQGLADVPADLPWSDAPLH